MALLFFSVLSIVLYFVFMFRIRVWTCKNRFKLHPLTVDHSKAVFLLQFLFVLFDFIGVLCDVMSCHSNPIWCFGRAVFHDPGYPGMQISKLLCHRK